ncbi:hypothetical protein M431DRAFT_423617 [Trichoderma harzianum CBS 226.95]|uniref:Uncharacterized protein n=1 Tax=Trichoderma harzianum CBS 226.95 TaxID=983964 RepID=A0A2T4ABY7_TRIHA|nr:hypothetical protein M431DRAFT_423617 [Trichoderma harzianum CBS 226.95]PTB54597.1 hypothetical protein M431DRAFT_423617 [Trichoderma harzianum CBS 226.95]
MHVLCASVFAVCRKSLLFAAISLTMYMLHITRTVRRTKQLTCNSPLLSLRHLIRTASL